jgi:hypothetical protein
MDQHAQRYTISTLYSCAVREVHSWPEVVDVVGVVVKETEYKASRDADEFIYT